MPRCRQLIRELRLLQLLESRRGRTLNELSSELGVTTRTIRRDLAALEEAGIPLIDERIETSEPRRDANRWRVLDWRKEAA